MRRSKLATALLLCLCAAPAVAAPADIVVAAANPALAETIVVRVRLNTEDKGDIFAERTPDRDFLIKIQDLKAMGFKDPLGTLVVVDGEHYISLRSMRGVNFEFQETRLALNISAEPQLLGSKAFGLAGQQRGKGMVPQSPSAFFNYALTTSGATATSDRVDFSGEVGWRWGNYLFQSDGNTAQTANGGRKFVRLMTSATHDDRDNLQRTVAGDYFTPSRDFSTGVSMGGVSVSKLYGLNPYLVQFPMQSIGGTVALPTDLEVYLDGQRIRTEKLQPGGFELRDILAYGGAQNVQLVLRDSFGRVQQLNYSFYFSDQPLRAGLHEYSYNLGAMRRAFGADSNRYGPAAFSMFHRYGFSNALTAGVRAEGTKHLLNAGPLATVVLGSSGVFSLALAASSIAGRQGAAGLASYTFQSRNWSMGATYRRDWREYASLGDPPMVTNRKAEGSLTASYYLPQRGTVSLSHSFLTARSGVTPSIATPAQPFKVSTLDSRRVTTVSYSAPLVSGWASFVASLSHIKEKDKQRRNEVFVGVTVFLSKDYFAAANYRGDRERHFESLQFSKNQPVGEGLGYVVTADRASDPTGSNLQLKSNIQYNAPAAILRAELGRYNGQGQRRDDYRLSVSGGVGYVGGSVALGRPITDSFGIVQVGKLADVGVLVNGQLLGRTNAQGQVFVPTLSPYFDNDVSIAAESVPIEYSIPSTVKKISPSLRGGALIDFAVTKVQAFSGKLKYQQGGASKPVEYREITFMVEGTTQSLQTGRGGEFYIENLKPGIYAATVPVEGKPCLFDLDIPKTDETFVELGDLECRPRP